MSIFENVSSTVGRLLALLSLSLLAGSALAQSPPAPTGFTLDGGYPQGGTASGSSPSSQYATNGSTRTGDAYGTGADSCSGPIQYSWTWHGPGPAPSC